MIGSGASGSIKPSDCSQGELYMPGLFSSPTRARPAARSRLKDASIELDVVRPILPGVHPYQCNAHQ
jgi:hypothetical protein